MQNLLRLEILRHEHNGPVRELLMQPRGQERMARAGDAATRQCAAQLHTPQQALRGGSVAMTRKQLVEHAVEPHQQTAGWHRE